MKVQEDPNTFKLMSKANYSICNDLVKLNDKYYGDPMDLEIFNKFETLKNFN